MSDDRPVGGADSGLACLLLIARYHGVAADPAALIQDFAPGQGGFRGEAIVEAARSLGLKARLLQSRANRLQRTPLPAIAEMNDGRFGVIAACRGDQVLVQDPAAERPQTLSLDDFDAAWSGRLILVARRLALSGAGGRFGFGWFLGAMLRYRALFGEVLLASFFLQLFALATPLFFQVVVDKVLVHRSLTTLDVLAIGLLGLVLFEVVLGGLRNYLLSHTTNRVDVVLGARLFAHLMRLPLAYFEARRVGDSIARVRELETIRSFLTGSTLTLVIDLFFTLVFLVLLYHYSPTLTLVVVGALPLYVLLAALVTPLLRRRLEEKFSRGADNQAFLVESVSGIQTLKSMAVETQMQRRWEDQLAAYVSASFKAAQLGNIAGQGADLINKLSVVLILWLGASLVMRGELSVGQLIAFNMIAARVSGPVLRLAQLWQDFQQAGISVRRLADILDNPVEQAEGAGRGQLPRLNGAVRLEQVDFRYAPRQQPVLRGVSLDVEAGEVIGIVGRSGSGKSTLGRLIQRLHPVESGRVLIDGVDIARLDPRRLRRQIGVVAQDSFLLNRSVRENIALGDPGMPLEAVTAAARLAGADEFINELPDGYDTLIGEHGANLSGGQRQRIALARALATNPAILILDEATSALDYESEHVIQRNMRAICRGRTVFVIAHRLSAVRDADRILVLDEGRIAEQGSHAALLQRGGIYARLHALQSGGDTGHAPHAGLSPVAGGCA
jgi:subfamily B ATP-binding cassette protein HlyB/CyaB